MPLYLAIALGMVMICALIPGRWMHATALGWFLLMFLVPVLLLAVLHRWFGLGLLPLVCVFVYTHFAWEHLRRTQNLLKREVGKLRAIASSVSVVEAAVPTPAPSNRISDPLREARQVMREIRSLQSTFVSMINQLPYPVFVVVDHKLSVWNAKAAEILAESVSGDTDIGPECDLEDTLLIGNPDMLIRALVNVIDNALKYSPSHTAITVRLVDESEDGMVLHIVDQGIGIAEEDLPHLFDPFFQVGGGKSGGDMGVGWGCRL